jgi:hypothetical protein
MSPPTLNIFSISPSGELQEVEREPKLAGITMAINMEFRNDILQRKKNIRRDAHELRKLGNSFAKVAVPLTK